MFHHKRRFIHLQPESLKRMSKERVEQVINLCIHRFLADGVIYRDLMDIRAAMPDWSQWCAVWSLFDPKPPFDARNWGRK